MNNGDPQRTKTNRILLNGILPGLPADTIRARYAAAPGKEVESGKFQSPESSAALVANAFGYFLDKPSALLPLPIGSDLGWQPMIIQLEVENRFPWTGGRHPWLDVVIETSTAIVGIESKRYEPFRGSPGTSLSDAYWRDVWGSRMNGYCRVRDDIRALTFRNECLDAAQLIKHAFGLRTTVHRHGRTHGKVPVLLYLFSEPGTWPDGRPVSGELAKRHREEIGTFSDSVAGDEVRFVALSYSEMLAVWHHAEDAGIRSHASAIEATFAP